MPTNIGSQNLRVSSGLLNYPNGDDFPGGGSVAPGLAPKQLGQKVWLGADEVKYSATVGTLYEGTYQYVQTYSGDANRPTRGQLAFWLSRPNYIVTLDDTPEAEFAGVFLNPVEQGKYWFIQVEGRATVNVGASNPAVGDIAFVAGGATAVANTATVAAITAAQLAVRIGKADSVASAGLAIISLDGLQN